MYSFTAFVLCGKEKNFFSFLLSDFSYTNTDTCVSARSEFDFDIDIIIIDEIKLCVRGSLISFAVFLEMRGVLLAII